MHTPEGSSAQDGIDHILCENLRKYSDVNTVLEQLKIGKNMNLY